MCVILTIIKYYTVKKYNDLKNTLKKYNKPKQQEYFIALAY